MVQVIKEASWWAKLLFTVGMSLAGYVAKEFVGLKDRVAVLEVQHANDSEHLSHIDRQVDRLVEWALGR